jgi:hypothetical protein
LYRRQKNKQIVRLLKKRGGKNKRRIKLEKFSFDIEQKKKKKTNVYANLKNSFEKYM